MRLPKLLPSISPILVLALPVVVARVLRSGSLPQWFGSRAAASFAVLYSSWYIGTRNVPTRSGHWGPRWLARALSIFLSRLLGDVNGSPLASARLPSPPVDQTKQHLVVWHPHGAYTCMAFMHCSSQSQTGAPFGWFPGVAPVLFNVPFFREMIMLMDARSVQSQVLDRLASDGLTVAIQPGGIPEQLEADSEREVAIFPPKLGFVRMAMRHGMPLLPVYVFGENQAYSTLGTLGRAFSRVVYRATGVPIVPITGKWGLPWLVPRQVDVHIRWGQPVPVGPANADPTDADVEAVFEAYVTELKAVFDAHKHECLPPEIAARGLTVVRRPLTGREGGGTGAAKRSKM
jgi:2-acylglycerol O-acyltransferase 2